ncbi:hypothetical protein RND81_05G267100 [Saponaria officinalis]|uniref:Uncharacterized protein n=1 Tax=Saponaria officinalis TaxID=3572 RepID=A0AAW1L2R9_SAPOF
MLKKRLDNGFNGFQVPFIPRAARSSRRRSLVHNKVEDNQLCAFDLLATVAGKILLDGESSDFTTPETDSCYVQDVVMEENVVGKTDEHCDREIVEAASPSLTLELGLRGSGQYCLEKTGLPKIDLNDEFCCHSEKLNDLPLVSKHPCAPSAVVDTLSPDHGGEVVFGNGCDSHNLDVPEILDKKRPELVSSDSSIKLTLGNEPYGPYPCSSQSPCRDNNVKVGSRDDDENLSECIQPSTKKTARSPPCIGYRRIRKLLASKYWKSISKARDGDVSDTVRCLYRSRKNGYKRPRSQRIYPFKKRRCYQFNSLSSSHGQRTSLSSRESDVTLRIKSFRVPELFIEMPETSTIGSLKRTVLQAVSALLGGGLRVGVLLQGKKIRDDNRTLLQSGICNANKVDSLGFYLEPNPSQVGSPVCSEENSLVLSADVPPPVSRHAITNAIHQGTSHLSVDHLPTMGNLIESDHDSAPSPAELSAEKGTVDSRALVARPEGTPQALAVVHSHQKSKRSDIGQRRIRRPFSVSEVEALVLAVEKLGTGRWRDVKLRAFDDANHRTYVDLKDKWKTLVHTASIAPQQRRGEPVPQELLDRVLAAHGFWTQHQPKQPPPQPVTCLLH